MAKVTYVGPLPPIPGGISQHGAQLIRALLADGHDVTAITWRAQYPRMLYPGGQVDPDAVPFPAARRVLAWFDPLSWWLAGRAARGADLLVLPWVTPIQAPAYRVVVAAARPTSAVAIVHNPVPHEQRPFDQALTRTLLRRLQGAVVHAEASVAALHRIAPGLPVAAVPHPPNLHVAATQLPPAPPYRLLFFGFVRPYKGLDVAFEALAKVVSRGLDVELVVAGEFWGPLEPWRRQLAGLGLTQRVRLRPGYVPDAEVGGLLAASHLVLAPYRNATQSGIVPIAASAGRAVVATAVGGLAEQVVDGATGVLAPPGDADALAAAIERALAALPALTSGARRTTATWRDVACLVLKMAG
jgi:glycosyltransferase involved in cell wall biosynthesis